MTSGDVSSKLGPMKLKSPRRITLTFEQDQMEQLAVISQETGAPVAALVRRATNEFITRQKKKQTAVAK